MDILNVIILNIWCIYNTVTCPSRDDEHRFPISVDKRNEINSLAVAKGKITLSELDWENCFDCIGWTYMMLLWIICNSGKNPPNEWHISGTVEVSLCNWGVTGSSGVSIDFSRCDALYLHWPASNYRSISCQLMWNVGINIAGELYWYLRVHFWSYWELVIQK